MNPADLTGRLIDNRYQVRNVLGSGGLGIVYLADQTDLDRQVAIKVLQTKLDADGLARFEREAKILASIDHPGVVKVFSYGKLDDDSPYMVIELLKGTTLALEIEKSGSLDWRQAARIGKQIAEALSACHKNAVIHRDLKPQNVMLCPAQEPDTVKVLDFGLSRLLPESEQKLTQTGALVGSVHYMSPEVCSGLKADERSDIYSFGCLLYECLSGQPPFSADYPIAMLHKHKTEMPAPLPGGIPEDLEKLVFACLAKRPEDRFSSMHEIDNALEAILDNRSPSLPAQTLNPRKQTRRDNLARTAVIVTLAVAAISTAVGFAVSQHREKIKATEVAALEKDSRFKQADEDLNKAEILTAQAVRANKQKAFPKAESLFRQAIALMGHSIDQEIIGKQGCLRILAMLKSLEPIYTRELALTVDELEGPLDIISSRDEDFSNENRRDLFLALARITRSYKAFGPMSGYYRFAVGCMSADHKPAECKRILDEWSKAQPAEIAALPEARFERVIAECYLHVAEGDKQKTYKCLEEANRIIDENFGEKSWERQDYLTNILEIEDEMKDLERAKKTLKKTIAALMIPDSTKDTPEGEDGVAFVARKQSAEEIKKIRIDKLQELKMGLQLKDLEKEIDSELVRLGVPKDKLNSSEFMPPGMIPGHVPPNSPERNANAGPEDEENDAMGRLNVN